MSREPIRYRPRRDGTGFRIEDTRTKELLDDGDEDFFVAGQIARERERSELAAELAGALGRAGWPELAADAERGVPPEVLLRRLREIGEGESEAARILADAPRAV